MNLGDYIKELRMSNGLTQEELGKRIGVKRAAVQKWECGRTQNLKRSTLQKLSEIFGVSPAAFISEEFDEMKNGTTASGAGNNIKTNIKKRRTETGMTLLQLSAKVGVSEGTVSRWESGDIANMRIDKIEALAKALDVTPAYLMGWEDLPGEKEATQAVPLRTVTLRPDEAALLGSYNKLNTIGKEKAAEYVSDLAGNKKYTAREDMGRMSS